MMRKALVISGACLLLLALGVEVTRGGWFAQSGAGPDGGARSLTVSAQDLYPGGGVYPLRRDAWGVRGPGLALEKISILTIGGDATAQTGLPEEETWQAVMERDLNADGRHAVLANAGVEGQGVDGHQALMRDWFPLAPGLKPHFVVFQPGLAEGGEPAAPPPDWWQGVRARSVFLGALFPAPAEAVVRLSPTAQPALRPLDLPSFRDGLKMLAQASHAMGAVPVFLTQPLTGAEPANRAMLDVCRDEGLLCLDLAREVAFETGDFYDYLHTTPKGAAKIGHWLAAKLAGLV